MTAVETRPSLDDLRRTSVEARKLIVQAIHHAGAGHLGGPLSAADILVALYFDQMNVVFRRSAAVIVVNRGRAARAMVLKVDNRASVARSGSSSAAFRLLDKLRWQ